MATKLAILLRRHPLIPLALLVASAVFGAHFGGGHVHGHNGGFGLWDGPA